jgi:hypothetical protein
MGVCCAKPPTKNSKAAKYVEPEVLNVKSEQSMFSEKPIIPLPQSQNPKPSKLAEAKAPKPEILESNNKKDQSDQKNKLIYSPAQLINSTRMIPSSKVFVFNPEEMAEKDGGGVPALKASVQDIDEVEGINLNSMRDDLSVMNASFAVSENGPRRRDNPHLNQHDLDTRDIRFSNISFIDNLEISVMDGNQSRIEEEMELQDCFDNFSLRKRMTGNIQSANSLLDTMMKVDQNWENEFFKYNYLLKDARNLRISPNQFQKFEELLSNRDTPIEEQAYVDQIGNQYEQFIEKRTEFIYDKTAEINGLTLVRWDLLFPSSVEEQEAFYDEEFKFSAEMLRREGLREYRIRDRQQPTIYHEDTIAEGVIFSELNLTAVSAALTSLIQFDERYKTKLIKARIFPQKEGTPCFSPNGLYRIKLYLNGTDRIIQIDDTLIENQVTKRPMLSTTARSELWPSLIEKSIMKLYRSEDISFNSNPSIEVFHLSGWIPEVLTLASIGDLVQLYQKISNNYEEGNVLLSLGRGGNVYFPVVGFKIKDGNQMIKLIMAAQSLKVKDKEAYSLVKSIGERSTSGMGDETEVQFLNWNKIHTYFDNLYLSWNPSIYNHRFKFTSFWFRGDRSAFWDEKSCLENCPQYLIKIPAHENNLEVLSCLTRSVCSWKDTSTNSMPSTTSATDSSLTTTIEYSSRRGASVQATPPWDRCTATSSSSNLRLPWICTRWWWSRTMSWITSRTTTRYLRSPTSAFGYIPLI